MLSFSKRLPMAVAVRMAGHSRCAAPQRAAKSEGSKDVDSPSPPLPPPCELPAFLKPFDGKLFFERAIADGFGTKGSANKASSSSSGRS